MKNNYYEILGVTPDSDIVEIKSAYRSLARKFHPDMSAGNIDKFKAINEAYETLSDERKRMQYNMLFGFYKSAPKFNNSPNQNEQMQDVPRKNSQPREEKTAKNKKETYSTEKATKTNRKTAPKAEKGFFEEMFTSNKSEKLVPQDGSNLTAEVSITISEAINGTSKVINILHTEQCSKCHGRKFINGAYCSVCGGTGEKTRQRKLTVKIPQNVKNETKLRIRGEGNIGKNGGKNGDLFLIIKIENNKNIRYEGQKVFYEVPIEPYEAVLGTSISLKTLEGNILIKIPPKTKSGQKFRVQQEVNGKIFEVFVTVHIEIPSYLSDDEIRLYEKLKKLSSGSMRENFINA